MSAHEHIKFWHDASLSNLELLHATYVTHTFAPHTHEGYVIGVIEQGAEQFTYQIQIRILHAKHLLRMGLPCIDTAMVVGFADQSHFSKHFKHIVGVPPGLYGGVRKKEQDQTRQSPYRLL
jgi:AraC-like DNA-binding protein